MEQGTYASGAAAPLTETRRPLSMRVRRFVRRQPVMAVCALIVVTAIVLAVVAPYVGLPDPNQLDATAIRTPPSPSRLLGTDRIGRDMFSRIVHGGRISLLVAFFGVLAGTTAGGVWGLLSGYAGGKFDAFNQRLVEIVMSIPGVLLAFVLAAVLQPSLVTVIIAIAALNVGQTARVIRGVTLSAKSLEYVTAARSVGARWPRVIALHVAPSTIAPFLVIFSAQVGIGIIIEAALGFLGVGVPPPQPSWGSLVGEAFLSQSGAPPWWTVVFPGLVVSIVVLSINLFGDGLRDVLDPRLRGAS